MRTGSKVRVAMLAAAVAISLVGALSKAAGAQISLLPLTCTAAGTVGTVSTGTDDVWTLTGRGSCQGDLGGTYFVDFAGNGTSNGVGLCDGSLLVRNLDLLITATLTNAATLISESVLQNWEGPLTTYPGGTPFVVTGVKGGQGAGVLWNHIFLNCTGNPVATFQWSFMHVS